MSNNLKAKLLKHLMDLRHESYDFDRMLGDIVSIKENISTLSLTDAKELLCLAEQIVQEAQKRGEVIKKELSTASHNSKALESYGKY